MDIQPVNAPPVQPPPERPVETESQSSAGTTPAPPPDSQKIVDFYA